jgi:hypothetical protein
MGDNLNLNLNLAHTPCSGRRMGGREVDWRDIPCPEPATTVTHDGKPVCEGHREHAEGLERERIAGMLTDDVPIERLRTIVEAGGLAGLLETFDALRSLASAYSGFVGNTGWTCRDNRDACQELWRRAEVALAEAEAFRVKEATDGP